MHPIPNENAEGILLVNKPRGATSFSLVHSLRKILGVRKIGHAGTLDPFATGVMVMLVGRQFTKLSDELLSKDKEYLAQVYLGTTTDTFDCDGQIQSTSPHIPPLDDIEKALEYFQGTIEQIPPMFSAKKVKGKKLYELARKGQVIERQSVKVDVNTRLISYNYPYLELQIKCSKGTYIRSIAHDLGQQLSCGAHLTALQRTRSGAFHLQDCVDGGLLSTLGSEGLKQELKRALP
jgi:tRNA pseudouridine55 synthase